MPALLLGAAACLLTVATFRIFDTDLWQHLVRAKAMLTLRAIPRTAIWTWPMYGTPEKNAAWGFALLLWPFWSLGQVLGLQVFRWLAILGAFGIAWRVATRLGARGPAGIVGVVGCAMVYRQRLEARPEMVAVVLLGLVLWILETRRHGGADRSWWIVPIAWVWPNVHVSYYVGWLVLAIFALADTRDRLRPRRTSLPIVLAAAVAVSFLNPFGPAGLSGPLEFLRLRQEPLYRGIGELHTIDWSINWQNGLPLWMLAWPALQLWRRARGRGDRVEALLWALFTVMAFSSQRFLTFWAVAAAPYLARDLDEWFAARRRRPRRAGSLQVRHGIAAAACVALTALEMTREAFVPGIGLQASAFPGPACDFMAAENVRGRGFNYFEQGGYLLWRFWPEHDRLPFMTTIPELATPEMRFLYQGGSTDANVWRTLDDRDRFAWVLLERIHAPGDRRLDILDADSTFALVFLDDVSALYVRRAGALADLAARERYAWMPAGEERLDAVGQQITRDSVALVGLRRDLERAVASSPLHASTSSVLASLYLSIGLWDRAERALDEAVRLEPRTPKVAERREKIARGRAASGAR
jgi:hypothetical protein